MRRALILLPLVLLAACKTSLFEGLDEDQANRIIAVLSQHGIDGSKERNADKTWNVLVADNDAVTATELAGAYALPRGGHANLGELFSRQGLISSPEEDHVRYVFGLTQEIAETLEKLDGVLLARVHIVDPQRDPLIGPPAPPSASVMLRYRSDVNIEPMRDKIRSLVAGAVENLTPDRVYVTLVPVVPAMTPSEICSRTGVCPASTEPRDNLMPIVVVLAVMSLMLMFAIWIWDAGIRTLRDFRVPGITFFRRRTRRTAEGEQDAATAAPDSSVTSKASRQRP